MEKKESIPMIGDTIKKQIMDFINENELPIENLHMKVSNNKYIFGMAIPGNEKIDKVFQYNHFIESIYDLVRKTKISIQTSLKEYENANVNDFNPITGINTFQENNACYYMENALFREIMLWDSLAQLYNLYYNLNIKIEDIHYKNIIKKLVADYPNDTTFQEIESYITEAYDIKNEDPDVGVHDYVLKHRNQMTHRFSIAVTAFSQNTEENIFVRATPELLYKIAKDYNIVMKYLMEITKKIITEIEGYIKNGELSI